MEESHVDVESIIIHSTSFPSSYKLVYKLHEHYL